MTTIWLDGFDNYINGDEAASTPLLLAGNYEDGVAAVNDEVARTGLYSLRLHNDNWCVVKTFDPVQSCVIGAAIYPRDPSIARTWGLGFAANFLSGNIIRADATSSGDGFLITSHTNQSFRVIQYTTVPGVSRTETVLYTSKAGVVPTSVFTYLELKVNGATGVLQVWKNGNVKIVEISGLTIAGDFDGFTVGRANGGGNGSSIDDLYVTDGNLLGAQRCYYLFPNADESPQDWTPSTGTDGFAMLDNVPYSAQNISSDTVGDKSKFACQNLPMTTAILNSMRISTVQSLATSGSGLAVSRAFIGASTFNGAAASPSTSPAYFNDMFDLGSVSVGDINAMSLEIEKTA